MTIDARKQQTTETDRRNVFSIARGERSQPLSVTPAAGKPVGGQAQPSAKRELWERFITDSHLLGTHRVTPEELEHLRIAVMLGNVKSHRDILVILRQTRATVGPRASRLA